MSIYYIQLIKSVCLSFIRSFFSTINFAAFYAVSIRKSFVTLNATVNALQFMFVKIEKTPTVSALFGSRIFSLISYILDLIQSRFHVSYY